MRWIVLIIIVLVAGGALVGWHFALKEQSARQLAEECVTAESSMYQFVRAVKSNDATVCQSAKGVWKSRCQALIVQDPGLCGMDPTCEAIAKGNGSLCNDVICQALAEGNLQACERAPDDSREFCRNLVSLNVAYFAPNETACRDFGEGLSSGLV